MSADVPDQAVDSSTGESAAGDSPAGEGADVPTSGLKDPAAAVRRVAAASFLLQALVLLMALVPIAKLSGLDGGTLAVLLVLLALCVAVCGVLGRSWGWYAATVVQVAVLAGGFLQWALFVVGGAFCLVWLYVLWLRRTVNRPARFDH